MTVSAPNMSGTCITFITRIWVLVKQLLEEIQPEYMWPVAIITTYVW